MAYEFASRLETFPNYRKFETTFAGRPFVVETGKMCGLSNGSAMIRYGETCVLCNVTMSDKPRDGVDFFPLSVEFEEKLYAAGRIPGSFMRREGRPGERAILTSRVVDRPMRPLFPKEMRNDASFPTWTRTTPWTLWTTSRKRIKPRSSASWTKTPPKM